jgi:MFS family permease
MTINERVPFLGLAIVAWLLPMIGIQVALWATFLLLIWQGLGAGFTATAWQSLIAKIIPPESRGTFYGAQASIANVFSSLSAVGAGIILDKLTSPNDFVACFMVAALMLAVSWFFLAQTREPESEPVASINRQGGTWQSMVRILSTDKNFDWFLVARNLAQFGTMGFAFYTVYAVRHLGMDEITVGILTSVLMAAQIIANPLMGWLGDRWSHRLVMSIGLLAAFASSLIAWNAKEPTWFYTVMILAGIAIVGVWTTGLALILEFGQEADRPMYIGLANTLTAPATFLAPLLGGLLADSSGFQVTFLASAAGGLLTALVLFFFVRDPRREMYN